MEFLDQIRQTMGAAIRSVYSGVREMARKIKEFLADAYNDIVFRLDEGYEASDVTDIELTERCRIVVVEVLGDLPFEQFAALTPASRQNAVLEITARAAEAMSLEIGSVEFAELNDCAGYYSFSTNRICYHVGTMLASPMTAVEAKEALDTVFHELRHVYQLQASRHPSLYGRDKLTAEIWRLNFKNYVSFRQNPVRYYHQPVEQDARLFALSIVNQFS